MPSVPVRLGERSYDITISDGGIRDAATFVKSTTSKHAVIITDQNVVQHANAVAASLETAGWRSEAIVLKPGEEQKSLTAAALLYDRLAELRADRKTLIVAVGGGVVGDLAGFVAATFNRGLPLFMVPTTLLAMVDSSVGGKVGVNHPRGKNLIGAFHQPTGVLIDPSLLSTLPAREFQSGLAEVVKYGMILDAGFFEWLEGNASNVLARAAAAVQHVVKRCCQLKADIVEQDEREERGLRAVLNYGHTFAHAFETVGGYGHWLHGEAVAAGMISASRLAERIGLVPAEVTERQRRLLEVFHLPTAPEVWPTQELVAVMRSDKKALAGKLRFVLPVRIGEVKLVDDVPEKDVVGVLEDMRGQSHARK